MIDTNKGDFVYFNDVVGIMGDGLNIQFAYDVVNKKQTKLNLDYIINSETKYASIKQIATVKEYLKSIDKVFNEETKNVEDVWQPKVGDVLVYTTPCEKNNIFIYKSTDRKGWAYGLCYINVDDEFITLGDKCELLTHIKNTRKATLEQEQIMHDRIKSEGYKLSDDKTELIKARKRVEKDEIYYYLYIGEFRFGVSKRIENYSAYDDTIHKTNNYFLTQEAAQKAADDLNAKLNLKEFFKNTEEE